MTAMIILLVTYSISNMISPLWACKVVKTNPFFARHKERDYRHRKDTRHDRSDNISHTTYYFSQQKSIAHVLGKSVHFLGSPVLYTKKLNNRYPYVWFNGICMPTRLLVAARYDIAPKSGPCSVCLKAQGNIVENERCVPQPFRKNAVQFGT